MAWYPARGGGIPASVKTDMNAVLNKKFGTSAQTYPPREWADDVNLMGLLPIRTASGAVASFSDGAEDVPMKSVVANIVPIQDLHGYSKPWAAGAGKNKLNEEISINNRYILANGTTAYNGTWGIVHVNIKGGENYTISGINYPDTETYFAWYDENLTLVSVIGTHKNYTGITAPNNAKILGMSFLMSPNDARYDLNTAQVEEGSTATSYEPYANVCPIIGTDELTLKHKGKNILNPNSEIVPHSTYGFFPLCPNNTRLTMTLFDNDTSVDISDVSFGFSRSLTENGAQSEISNGFVWNVNSGTITGRTDNVMGGNYCDQFVFFPKTQTTLEKIFQRFNIVVSVGTTTATTYEPYNAETYTFDLGQEIIGGTADVVGGVGEKTHGIVDLGDLTWTYRTDVLSVPCFLSSDISDIKNGSLPIACSCFEIKSPNRTAINGNGQVSIGNNTNAKYLVIRYDEYTDGTAVKTALTGQKLVYELATPTEYTFTGQPINSYLGVNNLYTDSGEVLDVEYRADMNLLIVSLEGNRGLQMMRATPTEETQQTEEETENEDQR